MAGRGGNSRAVDQRVLQDDSINYAWRVRCEDNVLKSYFYDVHLESVQCECVSDASSRCA